MSRTKSTGLIKAAARPKSDAGHAGWRPRVDMAASMQINGVRPVAVPVEPKLIEPIEPVRLTATEAREIHEDRERTERLDPQEAPRRMTQPGLFDALGVKV